MKVNKLNRMFAVILALSLVGACNPQLQEIQEIEVRLSSVEEDSIVDSSEFIAVLESLCSPTLKPPISGRVSKILAKLGDRVAADTPLIQLIPTQQISSDPFFISAPCAGIVSDIPVSEGENVSPSIPLITLAQTQPLDVILLVPLERADQVELGMPVELIDQKGQNVESLKITSISPRLIDNGHIRVKARFDNAKEQFRPGQLIRARLIWGQRPGLSIPPSSLFRAGKRTFVFVAESREESQLVARKRVVKLGKLQGDHYQVISGLQPGEKLIISGVRNLSDGAAITLEQ